MSRVTDYGKLFGIRKTQYLFSPNNSRRLMKTNVV